MEVPIISHPMSIVGKFHDRPDRRSFRGPRVDRTSTSGRAVLERGVVQAEDMQSEAVEFSRGYE